MSTLYSLGVLESFSSSGQASFHDFCLPCAQGASGMPFSIGVGQRSTPTFATPLLVDLELGVVIHERFRVAVEGVPIVQLLGQVGIDLAHLPFARPDDFGAITLWLGGGYQHLSLAPLANQPQLYGAVASARATVELKWGAIIVRPEVFARLQFVTEYDQDNDGEGNSARFTAPLPTFQVGLEVGIGLTAQP